MTPDQLAYMATTPEVLPALKYDGWRSMELTQKPDSPTCAKQAMALIRPLITW